MRVGKRGKDLAVRIPAEVVKAMGLQIGEEVDLRVLGPRDLEVVRRSSVEPATMPRSK